MHNLTDKEYSDLMLLVSEVRQYTKNYDVNEYNGLDEVNQKSRWYMRRYTERILNDLKTRNNSLHQIITRNNKQ